MGRSKGTRDSFKNLLERHPGIQRYIDDLAHVALRQGLTIADIHSMMLMELRDRGVCDGEYPFNIKSLGYYGLRLHLKKINILLKERRKRRP